MTVIKSILCLSLLMLCMAGMIDLMLDAAIKEQDFQDNLRTARCAKMSDYERNRMKGYCHD